MLIDQQNSLLFFFLACHDDSKRVHFGFEYECVISTECHQPRKRVHVQSECANFIFASVFGLPLPATLRKKEFGVAHAICQCSSLPSLKRSLIPKFVNEKWIEFLAHHSMIAVIFFLNRTNSHALFVLMMRSNHIRVSVGCAYVCVFVLFLLHMRTHIICTIVYIYCPLTLDDFNERYVRARAHFFLFHFQFDFFIPRVRVSNYALTFEIINACVHTHTPTYISNALTAQL